VIGPKLKEEAMSLLIVGSVALDSIKTPYGGHSDILGGSAVHASMSASFHSPVNLVGVVGDDFPQEHVDFLSLRGIDVSGLEIVEGKTFRWAGYYENDMNQAHTLDTQLNVFADFVPKIPVKYQESKYLFLGNIHPVLQLDVLNKLSRPELVAMDTMNFWIDSQKEALSEVVKNVDILFINDAELRQYTNESNLINAARTVLNQGLKYVIVKKGEHGSMIIGDNLFFACPAFPVDKLADPTGAGDTFAGGFMGYVAKTKDMTEENLKKALVVGTIMSSFNVEAFSLNRLKTLTIEEVAHRYNSLRAFTSFTDHVFE